MISKRLQYIIDIMDRFDIVADIGTDHGYIPVNLIKNCKASKVIASDISKKSLQKAKYYVKQNNMQDCIDTRLGNGIDILKTDEADSIVIAGMGGVLISDILKKDYDKKFIKNTPVLILQPVQQVKELRYYLYENNFKIIDEHIIKDLEKIYHIIVAKKHFEKDEHYLNLKHCKDVYMEFGIINLQKKQQLLSDIMKLKIEKIKEILNILNEKSVDENRIEQLSKELEDMEEIFYETWGIGKKA